MRLTSSTDEFVELEVVGYQFGAGERRETNDWDANWLIIKGTVNSQGETWNFRDPCLTTWEARELLQFLKDASNGRILSIDFTEPNLSITSEGETEGETEVTLTFRGEAAPPSIADDQRWHAGRQVKMRVPQPVMEVAVRDWSGALNDFPAR
jgi:hypothetical protein